MGLQRIDFLILLIYLAGITVFGVLLRRRQGGLRDYFLGGHRTPWWAIMLSIVAAETSVLTIISTPGLAYAGNLTFLQLVLGYLAGRVVISALLLPQYFQGELFTAYQLMERRFGARMRRVTAGIFLIGRALAEGVRLFAIAIVAGAALARLPALGLPIHFSLPAIIIILTTLTLIYTAAGGLRAVIWTDVLQICIYMAGAGLSLVLILHAIPGGWARVWAAAAAHGHKFQVFDFAFSWRQPYTFWSGVLGGMFLTAATDGTDQLIVQRLLAARNLRDSRKALFGSWLVIFAQFAVFLVIGVLLFVYHLHHPRPLGGKFGRYDRIYPSFIARHFPVGLGGLVLAAIIAAAMSNLSAALNSLSSATVMDFYRAWLAPEKKEAHYLRVSRLATVFWALILGLVAYASRHSASVLELGLTIVSIPFSGLLGVFVLGTATRRTDERGALVGMAAGIAVSLGLYARGIPFTWFLVLGTLAALGAGYGVSRLWPQRKQTQA